MHSLDEAKQIAQKVLNLGISIINNKELKLENA